MTSYSLTVLPLLWPHILFVLLVSWVAARAHTLWRALAIGCAATAAVTGTYWLIQNGVAPDRGIPQAGQTVAVLIAGSLPLLGASLASFWLRGQPTRLTPIAVGTAVGLLLLLAMPTLLVGIGCALTGICP